MDDKTVKVTVLCTFCGNVETRDLPKQLKGLEVDLCMECNPLAEGLKDICFHEAAGKRVPERDALAARNRLAYGETYHIERREVWQHGTNIRLKEFSGSLSFTPWFNFKLFVPPWYEVPNKDRLEKARQYQRREQERLDREAAGAPDAKYRICADCGPAHYENCETCYGFGVTAKGGPLSAGESARIWQGRPIEDKYLPLRPCPECGSTVSGVPSAAGQPAEASAPAILQTEATL